jgi:hypothetical protein
MEQLGVETGTQLQELFIMNFCNSDLIGRRTHSQILFAEIVRRREGVTRLWRGSLSEAAALGRICAFNQPTV